MKKSLLFLLVSSFIFGILSAQEAPAPQTETKESAPAATEAPAQTAVAAPETAPAAAPTGSDEERIDDLMKEIEDIEERLDTVETSTLVDRVKLSFDYRFTLNSYVFRENSDVTTVNNGLIREDGNTPQSWNMRGRLKLLSRLGDSFKFTGWLTMYKQFLESAPGRYANDAAVPTYDLSRGTYPGDTSVYFERMYVDWFATDWLAFTVGRCPASGGEPSQLRYNDVPLATFNALMFDTPFDGLYSTINLTQLIGLKNSYFRLGYVLKFMPDMSKNQNNQITEVDAGSQKNYIAGLDMEIPGLNGSKFNSSVAYIPELKLPQVDFDYNKDGVKDSLSMPDSVASIFLLNTSLMFPRAFNSDFDVFLAGGMSQVNPAIPTEDNPNNGFVGTPAEDKKSNPLLTVLGSDLSGESLNGYIIYTGFRYNIPYEMNGDRFRVGAEYNYASKNYLAFYANDTTGLPKFGIKGHNLETYFMVPLDRKANLRLSYIYQKHLNEWGIMAFATKGVPEIDETIHNVNLMLNVYF